MSTPWFRDEYRFVRVRVEYATRDGRTLVTETSFQWPQLTAEALEGLANALDGAINLADQCRAHSQSERQG